MRKVASWVIEDLKTPGRYFYDLLANVIYGVFTGPYFIIPETENQFKFLVPYSALVQMNQECAVDRTIIYFVTKENHDDHIFEARRLEEKLITNNDGTASGRVWGVLVERLDTYVYTNTPGDTNSLTERKSNTAKDLETGTNTNNNSRSKGIDENFTYVPRHV